MTLHNQFTKFLKLPGGLQRQTFSFTGVDGLLCFMATGKTVKLNLDQHTNTIWGMFLTNAFKNSQEYLNETRPSKAKYFFITNPDARKPDYSASALKIENFIRSALYPYFPIEQHRFGGRDIKEDAQEGIYKNFIKAITEEAFTLSSFKRAMASVKPSIQGDTARSICINLCTTYGIKAINSSITSIDIFAGYNINIQNNIQRAFFNEEGIEALLHHKVITIEEFKKNYLDNQPARENSYDPQDINYLFNKPGFQAISKKELVINGKLTKNFTIEYFLKSLDFPKRRQIYGMFNHSCAHEYFQNASFVKEAKHETSIDKSLTGSFSIGNFSFIFLLCPNDGGKFDFTVMQNGIVKATVLIGLERFKKITNCYDKISIEGITPLVNELHSINKNCSEVARNLSMQKTPLASSASTTGMFSGTSNHSEDDQDIEMTSTLYHR